MSRVAIYVRVSTDKQTTDNQLQELRAWATRAGHEVVKVYADHAISGSKGREARQQFDAMLKGATRREFDVVAVWSADRLGRSLQHLIDVLNTIRTTGRDLYIHTQALDTTTPAGRAMFGMLAVFGEFEREMIVARVHAGLARAKAQGRKLGRPALSKDKRAAILDAIERGDSVRQAARAAGVSVGAVAKIRSAFADARQPA